MKKKTQIRLDKYLSDSGLSSRRHARRFLKENDFRINGVETFMPDTKIDPTNDTISLNGEELSDGMFVYYLLNKPKNIISTTSDELGREDVTSLIPTNREIFPVGRLDKDTTGLILLTDDGELAHQLTHPRYHVPKTYQLTISGKVSKEQLEKLKNGVELNDGKTKPAEVSLLSFENDQTILELTIVEGRNRQIRRMCGVVGIKLVDLTRIAFGLITMGEMKEKEYRELTTDEIAQLKDIVTKKEIISA